LLRVRLHLLVPVHQQLPHVPLLQTRHPEAREALIQQQPQHMRRIPQVGLLLAHHAAADLRRISQPQLVPQLLQQALEPRIVSARFHPHPHRPRQRTVEPLRFFPVPQAFFLILPGLIVQDRDLLKPRMKITAYNQPDVGSFSSLGLFVTTNLLVATSQRRYAIKWAFAPRNLLFYLCLSIK